jgi:hypothetical protein
MLYNLFPNSDTMDSDDRPDGQQETEAENPDEQQGAVGGAEEGAAGGADRQYWLRSSEQPNRDQPARPSSRLSGRGRPRRLPTSTPRQDRDYSERRFDRNSAPPPPRHDEPENRESCKLPFDSDRNNKMSALFASRAGPKHLENHSDERRPNQSDERLVQDERGDWVPKSDKGRRRVMPNWDQPARDASRPFQDRLPSLGETINPNTTNGRYINNLLQALTEREKKRNESDAESTRSFRMKYSEKPKKRGRVDAPPPDACDDPATEIARLRYQLAEARHDLHRAERARESSTTDGGRSSGRDRHYYRHRDPFPDTKSIKVPKFNGKDFAAFRLAFTKCAKLLRWDEEIAQTQLICTCEGSARNMLMTLPEGASVVDMLNALELRYGVNMSYATVDNKLVDIRRKPGESLHDLYDRVTSLARRADYSARERASKERHAFFQALRTDSDLQHYVGRHDKTDPPSIDVTLALAVQYEMSYGRKDRSDSASAKQVTTSSCADTDPPAETVNRLQYSSLKHAKDPLIRQLGMQQNEIIELLKGQHSLMDKHMSGSNSGGQKFGGARPKQYGNAKPSQSSDNKKPSSKPPHWKNKKPGQKPFKPKAKVHQVEEEEEEEEYGEEQWEPDFTEEATADCNDTNLPNDDE